MQQHDLIRELKWKSSWLFVGLQFITFGIYAAHYIKKQTAKINDRLRKDEAISDIFVVSIFAITYLYTALSLYFHDGPTEDLVFEGIAIIGLMQFIMLIIWSFMARNRMNKICSLKCSDELWTFCFPVFYFNYRVNELNEKIAEQVTPVEVVSANQRNLSRS